MRKLSTRKLLTALVLIAGAAAQTGANAGASACAQVTVTAPGAGTRTFGRCQPTTMEEQFDDHMCNSWPPAATSVCWTIVIPHP